MFIILTIKFSRRRAEGAADIVSGPRQHCAAAVVPVAACCPREPLFFANDGGLITLWPHRKGNFSASPFVEDIVATEGGGLRHMPGSCSSLRKWSAAQPADVIAAHPRCYRFAPSQMQRTRSSKFRC